MLSSVLLLSALPAVSRVVLTSAITADGTLGTTVTETRMTYAISGGTCKESQDFHNDRLGIRRPTLGPGDVQRITEQALMRPAPQCSPPREILFQLPSCT